MRWLCSDLSHDVRLLLEAERLIAPVPASTRARAIIRAREALASRSAAVLLSPGASALPPSMAIAGLIGLASVVAGFGAFEIVNRISAAPALAASPPAERPGIAVELGAAPIPATEPPALAATPSEHPHPGLEDARDELRLLDLARAKLAKQEFAAAMSPLAEHARRFRQGRLTEEREALRLRALSGLGRWDELRRAAAAFEARFPRSPLVPVVRRMASSDP